MKAELNDFLEDYFGTWCLRWVDWSDVGSTVGQAQTLCLCGKYLKVREITISPILKMKMRVLLYASLD